MEKSEFSYKRRPAFISFLLLYIFCFGIAYLLIKNSPGISDDIKRQFLSPSVIQRLPFLRELPYGIILSVPFLLYGLWKLLWNIMSLYEITSSEIRLVTGSLVRKEQFFIISDFYSVSFEQDLLETLFGIGTVILRSRHGKRFIIKGVYTVKSVVEVLRPGLGVPL
jgi:hypothetical protein